MAKEEPQGEFFRGLEIEIDGEVGEESAHPGAEELADDPWLLVAVGRGRDRRTAWSAAAGERSRSWQAEARRLLTWRAAAWVAGAALLGLGIGLAGEPTAKQAATRYLSTDYDLHFGDQPVTAPGQARMANLAGAAWSVSPVTSLVVHVVNDGPMTLRLHPGTLTGQHITDGKLVPDGSGVLAPGQSGTLTAQVTLYCGTNDSDVLNGAAAQPLIAAIPVSSENGPTSTVQLVSGSKQDDLYIAGQLCGGLPSPLAVTFQSIAATAKAGGAIRITMHNITGQPIRYSPEYGLENVDTVNMQVIAAGATVVIEVPLVQICVAPGQSLAAPSVGVYISTTDDSYQTGYEEAIDSNSRIAVCHG